VQGQSVDENVTPENELRDETSFQKSTYWLRGTTAISLVGALTIWMSAA